MIIALRLFGKKELSQLNTADVILILLISNAVQNAMVGADTSLTGGLAAAAVLFVINFVLKKVMFRYDKFNVFMSGKPEILILNGIVDDHVLKKVCITTNELLEAMREHGTEKIADVKLAMLEVDGNISIITGDKNLQQTKYKRKHNHKNLI